MKIIIAGSRTITDYQVLLDAVADSPWSFDPEHDWIISGGAKGVDTLAEQYAVHHEIPLWIFHADWDRHGKSAGVIRNEEMGRRADALLAIWDGKSPGTRHMVEYMARQCKPVHIFNIGVTDD